MSDSIRHVNNPARRTMVLVDDDAVFGVYKAQYGTPLASYGSIELPSYQADMGAPETLDEQTQQALTSVGIDHSTLTAQQRTTVHHLLQGNFGENATVIGFPREMAQRIKALGAQDRYRFLRRATFGSGFDKHGGNIKAALKRDGAIQQGDYYDRFSSLPDPFGRKTPAENERDLEGAIIEAQLTRTMPEVDIDVDRTLNGQQTEVTSDIIMATRERSVRKNLLTGMDTMENLTEQRGHTEVLARSRETSARGAREKQLKAAAEAERRREAHQLEQMRLNRPPTRPVPIPPSKRVSGPPTPPPSSSSSSSSVTPPPPSDDDPPITRKRGVGVTGRDDL